MEVQDPLVVCEKCGGKMIAIRIENPAMSRCEDCGHEVEYIWDPAFAFSEPEDDRDAILFLEDSGTNILKVAKIIRTLDGLDSPSALSLTKMNTPEIGRRIFPRIWQLIQLQEKLEEAGAKTRLERIYFDNKMQQTNS